jgi:ADP-heptose:LPS heptosyltransferase
MLDKLRLWWWMWNSPVDIFIVSTQDWGRALWGFFGGARTIVAYRRVFLDGRWHSEKLKWALSVSCGDVSLDEQETERNMRLLETLKGSKVELAIFEPRWWNKDEEKTATALLKEYGFGSGRFVAVVPGTKRSSRMWQVEKWAELLKRLKQEFGLSCVILGAESEKPVCSKIKSIADKDVADLSGKTGIGELLYLVSEAALVVSVDTGVAHLANCFSKPMVVLFGPGELPKWKPFGNPNAKVIVKRFDCAPCYNYSCPKGEVSPCMAAIEVSDVMSAIYGVLKR